MIRCRRSRRAAGQALGEPQSSGATRALGACTPFLVLENELGLLQEVVAFQLLDRVHIGPDIPARGRVRGATVRRGICVRKRRIQTDPTGGDMVFQFKAYFRTAFESVFYMKAPWTPTRVASMVLFFGVFPAAQVVNKIALTVDELLYPDYKKTPVREPVFIIGNARSGTTLMQRLMSLDEDRFSSLKLWDLILLPIWMKKIVHAAARFDQARGGKMADALERVQARLLRNADAIHQLRLNQPEEDEGVMIHVWASAFLGLVFPVPVTADFMFFDEMPGPRRKLLMGWYKRCIQRHLYCQKPGLQLLSKNPMFTTKISSVLETFPDARVIYMVRSPYETVASVHNLVEKLWNIQLKLPPDAEPREKLAEHCYYSYDYALSVLDNHDPAASYVVKYDDLVKDPMAVITKVYEHFGYTMSDRTRARFEEACERARRYKSRHKYSLEQYGFTREQVYRDARRVFERFGFDKGDVKDLEEPSVA